MKLYSFIISSTAVLFLVVHYGHSQEINFSNKKQVVTQTTSKKTTKNNNKQNVNSKNFKEDNGLRAASTCYNCECQCDSYVVKDKQGRWIGNCKTADVTGAEFCYVSGRALQACGDLKISEHRTSSNGRRKRYSYEACATPTRNECYRLNQQLGQQYGQNCGDGDYNNGGSNNGGYPNNNGGYPNNNGGYPNNNNGGYPNNNNGGHQHNNNGGWSNNNNGGYPNNNNGGYPSNNGNSWTLQSQIPGLGSPRSDKDKDTSVTFGEK